VTNVQGRRRGAGLEHAIYEAVFVELAEVGYGRLTIDGVAARAGAGKASLYRRWASKDQLVLNAIEYKGPELRADPVDTGELRADLIQLLGQLADTMAKPIGRALYATILEMKLIHRQHSEIAATVIDTLLEPRMRAIMAAMRAGARRGEARPAAVSELLVRVGPALVIQQLLQFGTPPTAAEITDIVDQVLLIALRKDA
jgi:AcrR family transcriptional regulator